MKQTVAEKMTKCFGLKAAKRAAESVRRGFVRCRGLVQPSDQLPMKHSTVFLRQMRQVDASKAFVEKIYRSGRHGKLIRL